MDAVKIYDDAVRRLEKSEITLGEFEKLIEPLRNVSEQKKGKWVDGRCSQCGREAYWKGRRDVYGWQEFALELTKYCPNCGAKMEGGEQ